MLSVPLMLFRGGDASLGAEIRVLTARSKPTKLASVDWFSHFLTGLGAHLTTREEHKTLPIETAGAGAARSNLLKGVVQRSGEDQERPASSPCPSSSSSSDSSARSSESSSDSSNSSSDSEDEASLPAANGNSTGGGNGGDDQQKKDDEDDGNSSDSSSDSSTDESDQEEDDGIMIDTDDEKDKVQNGVDPTDDDVSGESDGSSDLENSYPQLPSAPVDTLIAFRQQAAQKELQLTEKLKKEVIADARQRHQDRQRSKKKKTSQSKRRNSKSDVMSNGSTHLERHHANGTADGKLGQEAEDEWMVDCSCGLKEKNYDDGSSMIQCDSCAHWVHAKCADKQPEAVAQEKFMCFRCSWMFDCVCEVRNRPNHDDGQRMVECESCKTWQHTMCVGIPMGEEPADDYRCPRCVKKARRRKSSSKGSGSRDRQRKQSHSEQSRYRRKSSDASPVVAVDVRSAARSIDTLTTPTRAHRSRRAEPKESPKKERKVQSLSPPPAPEVSPPSTPPPPPSSPPPLSVVPSHAQPRSSKRDRSSLKRRSERERERERKRSSGSSSSPHRKRGRSLGSSPSSAKKHSNAESNEMELQAPPPNAVTPSPRGKGLMLRGYSPASARTDTHSSQPVDVHSPLSLTPRGSSGHSYNSQNHSNGGRKRRGSSARDRLAKKLKIKKSSLR